MPHANREHAPPREQVRRAGLVQYVLPPLTMQQTEQHCRRTPRRQVSHTSCRGHRARRCVTVVPSNPEPDNNPRKVPPALLANPEVPSRVACQPTDLVCHAKRASISLRLCRRCATPLQGRQPHRPNPLSLQEARPQMSPLIIRKPPWTSRIRCGLPFSIFHAIRKARKMLINIYAEPPIRRPQCTPQPQNRRRPMGTIGYMLGLIVLEKPCKHMCLNRPIKTLTFRRKYRRQTTRQTKTSTCPRGNSHPRSGNPRSRRNPIDSDRLVVVRIVVGSAVLFQPVV